MDSTTPSVLGSIVTVGGSIVTATGSIIAAIITTRKNKTLKKENDDLNAANHNLDATNHQLNIRIQEVKLISTGMVVGYFYSFIQPLFDRLQNKSLTMVQGENRHRLYFNSTRLELYMPGALEAGNVAEVTRLRKEQCVIGAIEDENGHVLYKEIGYRILENSHEAIILGELPNMLHSALKYYQAPMYGTHKDLRDLLEKEMSNFKAEIQRMIENAQLENRIIIRQYA